MSSIDIFKSYHRLGGFPLDDRTIFSNEKELDDYLNCTGNYDGKSCNAYDGQIVYVSEIGEYFKAPNGENDARLRVIYSNGTESDLLMRSLKKALNNDKASRRILVANNVGPLFSSFKSNDHSNELEIKSGTIYILRSLSDNPFIKKHKDIIHKIKYQQKK